MTLCNRCNDELPSEGDFVTCGGCKSNFHYGCSTIRETVWRKYTPENKSAWKCGACKIRSVQPDDNEKSDINEGGGRSECSRSNVNINNDELGHLKELLKHKEVIIDYQRDLITSLKTQIHLMMNGGTNRNSRETSSFAAAVTLPEAKDAKTIAVRAKSKPPSSDDMHVPGGRKRSKTESDGKGPSTVECQNDVLPGGKGSAKRVNNDSGPSMVVTNHDLHEALTKVKLNDIVNLQNDVGGDNDWSIVTSKSARRRRPNRPIVGQKSTDDNCGLRAADSVTHWHVYRLHPDTTPEEVAAYLKNDFVGVRVERLNSAHPSTYSSFKITVREVDGPRIMDGNLWPSGARVNRFFLARKK